MASRRRQGKRPGPKCCPKDAIDAPKQQRTPATRGDDAHVEQQPRVRQHAQLEGRRQRQQLEGVEKIYEAREGRRRPDQKRRRAVVARRRQRRARHVREDRDAEQQLHLGQLREGAGALREAVGLLVLLCFGWCGWLLFLVLILFIILRFSSSYGLEFVEVDVGHCFRVIGARRRRRRDAAPSVGCLATAAVGVGGVLFDLWDALQQEKCVVREVTGARCRPNTPQTPPNSFKVRVEAPRCKKKQKNSKRTSKSIVL